MASPPVAILPERYTRLEHAFLGRSLPARHNISPDRIHAWLAAQTHQSGTGPAIKHSPWWHINRVAADVQRDDRTYNTTWLQPTLGMITERFAQRNGYHPYHSSISGCIGWMDLWNRTRTIQPNILHMWNILIADFLWGYLTNSTPERYRMEALDA